MGFWEDSIGELSNIPFMKNQDIKSFKSMIYAISFIIMFILSQRMINFLWFPGKHVRRIVYGLCFSLVNVSSIRCMWIQTVLGPKCLDYEFGK